MSAVFTMPGKMGDAILQWPIAYHYGQQVGDFEVWMDENTCKPLVPLFEAQPHVTAVKLIPGIKGYQCGGQPFHFGLPTSAFEGKTVYHLGYRGFPVRQITLQVLNDSAVPIVVDPEKLANEPNLFVDSLVKLDAVDVEIDLGPHVVSDAIDTAGLYSRPGKVFHIQSPKYDRLVLHAGAVYTHNRTTPTFWKFIASIRGELEALFSEIVFVGTQQEREVGLMTYPNWSAYDDGGDFLKLARLIAGSRCMIGMGSAPITLAGGLKVPGIRVHDPIANDAPKVIWNNLGENQLNDTELGLRKSWPLFRDQWLKAVPDPA